MERRTALEVLGLGPDEDLDLARVKQRFRMLARDLHPDLGGDPVAFQDLHTAYEALRSQLEKTDGERPPSVARGRPSRADDASVAVQRLDADELEGAVGGLAERVLAARVCRYLSRAPGARLNRFAGSLSIGSTSTLEVTLVARRTSTAPHVARVELTGRSRAARRALTSLDLTTVSGAPWSRRRGDATTVLEADLTGADPTSAARRAAAATARLLAALGWPMTDWRPA